jgi:predicted TPR repeat methyltransferase
VLEEQHDPLAARVDRAHVAGLGVAKADAAPAAVDALGQVRIGLEHRPPDPGSQLEDMAVLVAQVLECLGQSEQTRAVREDVKRIVETGYDAIADDFAGWQRGIVGSTRLERVEELLRLLPEGPDVLELGVGAGVRSTRMLAERGRLTGVDLSSEQLRRARSRVPAATFLHADFTEVEFAAASFDAVVAAYVLNHLPPDELGPLAGRLAVWLRPGGYFLASFATTDNPGWTGEWLGVEMYFAGLPPEENRRLVEEAGLAILVDEIEISLEPEGEARFQWLLARRPE